MYTPSSRSRSVPGWLVAGFLAVLIIKVWLAAALDLYSDEVFYWWASTNPAFAYSDLPFMTALLAGLGSGFGPADSLAVRSVFLLLGTLLPALVFWLAEPMTNRRLALESAGLTLCLPLAGFMGLLAVPDVPIIVFGLLSIGFFERALRTDKLIYWIGVGVAVACGLSTHYRFFLYPLAAVLFLVFYQAERKQWRNWRFWLAVLLAGSGLAPIVWFNLSNQLSSASFYLLERHPWEFQITGLLHVFKQAGLATPPLYLVFLLTLWQLYQKAISRDRSAALLFTFAVTHLAVYWVLAPWTDANSTSIHWPLSGYFPLLVAVPLTLRSLFDWCQQHRDAARARRLVLSIPLLGFTGTLIAFVGIGSQAFQPQLQPLLGSGVLSSKMAGWKAFSDYTQDLMLLNHDGSSPVVVTDNYYTAAQVEFAGVSSSTLTLDRDKAVRDGRIVQLQLWNKDEAGISRFEGQPALYINEDSTLDIEDKTTLMSVMCRHSTQVTHLSDLALFHGDKRFSFYRVDAIRYNGDNFHPAAYPCPYPMHAWIDYPIADAVLSGVENISGWAYSEDIGIATVRLLIDDEPITVADYGIDRLDVVEARNVTTDPNSPNLGFGVVLDTRTIPNGYHELALELTNLAGKQIVYGRRQIEIANW